MPDRNGLAWGNGGAGRQVVLGTDRDDWLSAEPATTFCADWGVATRDGGSGHDGLSGGVGINAHGGWLECDSTLLGVGGR